MTNLVPLLLLHIAAKIILKLNQQQKNVFCPFFYFLKKAELRVAAQGCDTTVLNGCSTAGYQKNYSSKYSRRTR